jgi:hypothetical protein
MARGGRRGGRSGNLGRLAACGGGRPARRTRPRTAIARRRRAQWWRMPRLVQRRGQEQMNSRDRFIAWASVGFSLIKESTKAVKLSVNGTGRVLRCIKHELECTKGLIQRTGQLSSMRRSKTRRVDDSSREYSRPLAIVAQQCLHRRHAIQGAGVVFGLVGARLSETVHACLRRRCPTRWRRLVSEFLFGAGGSLRQAAARPGTR